MRLLLDTHTFLWWTGRRENLASNALSVCLDPANTLLLSVASVWEMQIKMQLGKLNVGGTLPQLIAAEQASNQLRILPVELSHIWAIGRLPAHHKDPFDRMLIAQTIIEGAI